MPPTQPYQPSLLRLLHAGVALLVPLAWLSGFALLLHHERRRFDLPWQLPGDWVDIHGSVGALLWPIALLFGLYALTLGRARLRQAANATALVVLGLAVATGKLMDEDWLRDGELHHLVYKLHVLAWALLALAVIWHTAAALARGGIPLVRSMMALTVRQTDGPRHWPEQLLRFWQKRH